MSPANLFEHPSGAYYLFPVYVALQDLVKGRKVLELGCGPGDGAAFLADGIAEHVVGMEEAPGMVHSAQESFASPRLDFLPLEDEALPFDREAFDVVLHVRSPFDPFRAELVEEIARVLAKGGMFVAALPNPARMELPVPGSIPMLQGIPITAHQLALELRRRFEHVSLVAQSPAVGFVFHDMSVPDGALEHSLLDNGLVEGELDEAYTWLALCARDEFPPMATRFVRLGFDDMVSVVRRQAEEGHEVAIQVIEEDPSMQGYQERLVAMHQLVDMDTAPVLDPFFELKRSRKREPAQDPKIAELSKALDDALAVARDVSAFVTHTGARLDGVETILDDSLTDVARVRAWVEAREAELEEAERTNRDLQEALERAVSTLDELREELDRERAARSDLEQRLHEERIERERLERELGEPRTAVQVQEPEDGEGERRGGPDQATREKLLKFYRIARRQKRYIEGLERELSRMRTRTGELEDRLEETELRLEAIRSFTPLPDSIDLDSDDPTPVPASATREEQGLLVEELARLEAERNELMARIEAMQSGTDAAGAPPAGEVEALAMELAERVRFVERAIEGSKERVEEVAGWVRDAQEEVRRLKGAPT